MIEIRPVRGICYDLIKTGNPVSLVAPPYSLLTADLHQQYSERSPYNVVHLCPRRLSEDDSGVNSISRQPTARVTTWLKKGLLHRARHPQFYAYEQTHWGSGGRTTCSGVLGLLRLDSKSKQIVFPYHETHRSSRYGHDQLINASAANVCPVLALFDDPNAKLNDLIRSDHSPFPDMALTDDFDVEHRLFTIDAREQLQAISEFFADATLIIGEGQRTYQAALNYQRARHLTNTNPPTGPQPYDYLLTLFCNSAQPGLQIKAFHRVFRGLPHFDFSKLVKALNKLFYLNPVRSLRDVDGMLADLRDAGRDRPAFIIIGGGAVGRRTGYVVSLDGRKAAEYLEDVPASEARRRLDVTILDYLVLHSMLGLSVEEAEEHGYVQYFTDPQQAVQAGRNKDSQLLILLKPTPMAEIREVCDSDDHLPSHTAAFFPHRLSGLVMNDLSEF